MTQSLDGLLVIDKPRGITSRAAVDRAQGWFPKGTPIGHAGTLDPLATGILVLCIGAATRLTEYVQRMGKIYRAGILLGAVSDTDDADGTVTPTANAKEPARREVEEALTTFLGKIEQVPPAYSAAKVAGRRAYALARKGKEVVLAPRTVTIERIELERFAYPRLDLVVHCGKGTYIRSLARDLGLRLGCGGYIESLRRIAIGSFTDAAALPLDTDAATARAHLLPMWRAVQDAAPPEISDEDATRLRQGRRIANRNSIKNECAVVDRAGRMIAVVTPMDGDLQPVKVFTSDP